MLPSVDGGIFSFLLGGTVSGSFQHGTERGLRRCTETFIVRLWAEYLEQTPPSWRGEIQYVESGEVMRFGTLGEVSDCIRRCVLAQHKPNEEEKER